MRLAATCQPNPVRQGRRTRGVVVRPVWRQDISDPGCRVAEVGGFHIEVYRLPGYRRWSWHVSDGVTSVWSFQRGGARWLRWLAERDALREIARLRGGRI